MSIDWRAELKVLIVDDQNTMRSIIRRLLSQMGIVRVQEASDGRSAMERLGKGLDSRPDIVICDLHMEDGDGMSFCNQVRRHKNKEIAQTPVIILTGDRDPLLHAVAKQVGAVKVLTKPISAPDLEKEIHQAIGFSI